MGVSSLTGFFRMLFMAAALVLPSALVMPAMARAEPALWVVRDADSTLYLFGTIHMMRAGVDWYDERISTAFDSADELWLETDTAAGLGTVLPVMRYGMDWKGSLASRLGPEYTAKFEALARLMGAQPAGFRYMRPWLAALTLTTLPMTREGFQPAAGIDVQLEGFAARTHKPVRRLETISEQLRIFADLPPETEIAMLREVIDDGFDGVDETPMADLVETWIEGDEAGLVVLVQTGELKPGSPFYEALFTRRNEAWARKIEGIMAGAGTSFFAVGAGHLVGAGSVIELLTQKGFTVERL